MIFCDQDRFLVGGARGLHEQKFPAALHGALRRRLERLQLKFAALQRQQLVKRLFARQRCRRRRA